MALNAKQKPPLLDLIRLQATMHVPYPLKYDDLFRAETGHFVWCNGHGHWTGGWLGFCLIFVGTPFNTNMPLVGAIRGHAVACGYYFLA